ncbi:MAG: hypothetical protein BWK76_25310 [Desulfobulbaceae bacterium A2]|nr:MAG: hypothetical protein BWK76_25310 [Desulfobulbaceae bacterium A2]
MRRPPRLFRLLVIEDDPDRIAIFRTWIPDSIPLVVCSSPGAAIGVVERDGRNRQGQVYGGLMLDHDLQLQVRTTSEQELSGTDIVTHIIRHLNTDMPILIHSMNSAKASPMRTRLEQAGFPVSRIPMADMSQNQLMDWITECHEIWQENHPTPED